ncbi:MAG TPA: hypothetical protein ENI33_03965 [Thermoplasmatales archaeon]|nr:hypothetical protein [Thermoplasmatales archaeon]
MKFKPFLIILLLSLSFLSGCIEQREGKEESVNTPPISSLSVSPSLSGCAPFNITFYINAHDSDGYIVSWNLDVNSDGIAEFTGNGSELPKMINYTYTNIGNYTAKLIVTDNIGSIDESIVAITVFKPEENNPPTCSLSVNVTFGYAPLAVSFLLNASDSDGYIVSWNLDCNGDGIADYGGEGAPSSMLSYTYQNTGTYIANLTVEDNNATSAYDTIKIVVYQHEGNVKNITIASWNLQIFGVTKASNETLLNYYADKIDDYDLCIIQEIRDKSGTAIQKLAAKLPGYDYIISQRAGTTSSKEQYAIFYDDRVTLLSYHDYTQESQDEFERPPFEAEFKANNWTFTLYTIHTKPDNVYQELTNLENLIGEPDEDTIILGDLNTDGSYYDEDNIQHFISWYWVITNDMDTTVASSNNAYDRIIINQRTENNFIEAGVMKDVTFSESDHYLVYGIFNASTS